MSIDEGNALGNIMRDDAGASTPASKLTMNALDKAQQGVTKHNLGHSVPSMGSDNRESQGSQSGGAGSGVPAQGNIKSKTPNKAVQRTRNAHAARENGSQDTTGE